jgi:hypothetical protein
VPCQVLDIAPSTYWRHKQLQREPQLRSPRAVRHERLTEAIVRVHVDNYGVYGYRKIHAALAREGIAAGQDQVRRLMARAGLQGATRGRAWTITTTSTTGAPRAVDLVERQFRAPAPNRLWVSDFTTWRPGPGGATSRSSSTRSPTESWAGGSRPPRTPAWSSTPSNKPSTPDSRLLERMAS